LEGYQNGTRFGKGTRKHSGTSGNGTVGMKVLCCGAYFAGNGGEFHDGRIDTEQLVQNGGQQLIFDERRQFAQGCADNFVVRHVETQRESMFVLNDGNIIHGANVLPKQR
jgi:hypothetical protein